MTKLLRRFNYTKRTKIGTKQVTIETEAGDDRCVAVIRQLNLSERGQHSEAVWNAAEVYLEARRTTTESWARHLLGTVQKLQSCSFPIQVALNDFLDDAGITFRVKVVDQKSRLLADGDNIRAGEAQDADREPLIYLVPSDLGEELWRIDDSDADGPRVLVNKKLPNCTGLLTRDPLVRGLVMPQIVRDMLPRIARADQRTDPWLQRWSGFVKRLSGDDIPEFNENDDEQIDEWVDDLLEKFATEFRFATLAEEFLKAGDE